MYVLHEVDFDVLIKLNKTSCLCIFCPVTMAVTENTKI